jgi:hypothetical protein
MIRRVESLNCSTEPVGVVPLISSQTFAFGWKSMTHCEATESRVRSRKKNTIGSTSTGSNGSQRKKTLTMQNFSGLCRRDRYHVMNLSGHIMTLAHGNGLSNEVCSMADGLAWGFSG